MMVRVVGAGLSGLAAAWWLTEAGADVEVLDAAGGPGGLIETVRTPEGLVERAANGFVWTETTAQWFRDLAITPCRSNDASRRRFIFRDGRPRRWPLTAGETAGLAARAGWAWLRRDLRPRDAETIAGWSTRIGGRATTEWLAAPALQGIYAAPADRLSARAVFGGRSAGAPPRKRRFRSAGIVTPAGGMGEFIERLFDQLRARGVDFAFSCPCGALDPSVPTIVATPAPAAATLIAPHAPRLAEAIGLVPMTSIVSTTAFFAPTSSDLRGFGVLFPRETNVRALGVLFNTEIFEGRGRGRSETWIYGSLAGALTLPAADEVVDWIVEDRQRLTGRAERPIARGPARAGPPPSLPVYDRTILTIQERLSDLPPWLALAGNYLGRLGVAKLLDLSREAAERIAGGMPAVRR
jgi:oxygen-dependent protoporphyrinogen oxidase